MAGRSILIADDDQGILDLLMEILQKEGYELWPASDGREAVETVERHPIEVAILDMKMPVMDGLEALAQIKRIDPGLIAVVMTGYGDIESLREMLLEHGAFDYLLKPLRREEIVKTVRNAFLKREFQLENSRLKTELEERISQLEKDFADRTLMLRESQIKYKQIVEHSNDMIGVIQQGRLKYLNPKLLEATGYKEEEALDLPLIELIHPLDRKDVIERQQIQLEQGHPSSIYAFRALRKDGSIFWVEISTVRTIWEGKPAVLSFMRDVTERKRSEQALRRSEEKYRSIIESIEDGYYETDLKGTYIFLNEAFCRIVGRSQQELIGANYRRYTDKRQAEQVYKAFNRVYRTGEPIKGFYWELTREDGSRRSIDLSISLIRDADGKPMGFRGIARDVTERREMEEELVRTKNFLQSILDSSTDGICTTDIEGRITFVSSKLKELIGYEEAEVIGERVYPFYAGGREDARIIMKALREKGELRNYETRVKKKDGSMLDISLSASLLKDEKGQVIGTLGIYRDITEKKRLEAQFQKAQRMEAIATLAGGIAHDFNNLLMGIEGYTSLMLMNLDSGHPHFEKLKKIERHVQGGAKLTRQLLGYARQGKYEIRPVNLNRLIRETLETFGRTRKEITLRCELTEALPPIEADPAQIEQILFNLYINAADAMPEGGTLTLETCNVSSEQLQAKHYKPKQGGYVLLKITDTGIGMDKETMDRIFDPFFTTKQRGRGTGLGLASAYGIIRSHGGYIDVESSKGHGTTFSIYLPASSREEKEDRPAEGILKGTGTILLVDDEEMILDVGKEILMTLGYRVFVAGSGKEAIEICKRNPGGIDLVILDMVMPEMSGGETFDRLKELDQALKVLLSSGYSLEGQASRIMERGCEGFIQKPFTIKALSHKIREILDR